MRSTKLDGPYQTRLPVVEPGRILLCASGVNEYQARQSARSWMSHTTARREARHAFLTLWHDVEHLVSLVAVGEVAEGWLQRQAGSP
jgi:hypothetical protein